MTDCFRPARLRHIGGILRTLREKADLTQATAGRRMGRSAAYLSLVEKGRPPLRIADLKHMLDVYGVVPPSPLRTALLELCQQQWDGGWWTDFSDVLSPEGLDSTSLEWHASSLEQVGLHYVPGLLQTPDYALSVMRSSALDSISQRADRFVDFRLERQQVLGKDKPPMVRIVLDETVLRKARGGTKVMKEQLQKLLDESHRENLSLQVLPLSGPAYPNLSGTFTLLSIGRPAFFQTVIIDYLTGRLMIEDEQSCRRHRDAFKDACRAALPDTTTRSLIHQIRSEL